MKPTIVVTGASKGIGLAVTRILLQQLGANVVAISRYRTPELFELGTQAPDTLMIAEVDVTNETALVEVIQSAARRFHGLHGLVLNAGTLDPLCRITDNTPLDSWKQNFDVNFFSLVTAIRAAIPSLRENAGRVVFVSSGAAVKGMPGWGPYNASKAAMNSLCRTLAEEEPNVVSVAVRPGVVNTEMQRTLRLMGNTSMDKSDHQMFVDAFNQGKLVNPEDCGHVIATLALRAPRELSGQFVSWDSEECRAFRRL